MISSQDLITLANAKAYIGGRIAVDSPDNEILQSLISGCSSFILEHLNRRIALETYSEARNGSDARALMLRQFPVVSVSEVWLFGRTLVQPAQVNPISGAVMPETGYVIDRDRFVTLPGRFFGPSHFRGGANSVLVNYVAGYVTPATRAIAALPGWQPDSDYAAGSQVAPGNGFLFTTDVPGESGAVLPQFPTGVGSSVQDGDLTWLATDPYTAPVQGARMMPVGIKTAAEQLVALAYRQRDRVGDSGTGLGPERVNYFMGDMPKTTAMMLKPYRDVVPNWDTMPV